MEATRNGDPSTAQTSNNSANLVEIKIKTLDSQVYSCSVDQNITVPALKDHIATLTGVPAENQRLICRGKVLKDDHTLTDYNVEDGHTLHLVTKQVPQSGLGASSAAANAGAEEQRADDPSNGATHNRPTQISHSVVMGTFNVPDNGDGGLPDVNRIISSVLQSLGLGNIVPHAGPNNGGAAVNPAVVVAPAIGGQDSGIGGARPMNVLNHPATSDRGAGPMTWPTAGFGMLPAIGQQVRLQPTVTPDALTTINQYLDGLEQWFAPSGSLAGQHMPPLDAVPTGSVPTQPVRSPIVIRGYPTPANLGATIQRTMSLINGQGVVELNRLSSELENEPTTADTGARGELQSVALRDGVLLQHLGALLLELGRVTLTLRVGPSAMESAVNAGPAVFISPAGPNPMMVQPLPFQPGPGFGIPGAGSHHMAGAMGYPEVPRNVSIHIHANEPGTIPGFRAQGQGLATGNPPTQVPGMAPPVEAGTGSHTAPSGGVMPSVHAVAVPVQVGSSVSNEPGIRVVPMRTMVAAVPANLQGRSMVDGSGVHPSVLHPIFTRFQQLNSQQGGNLQGGTVASSTTALPPPSTSQPAASPAAPVPEGVAPDGQGFSRSSANDALGLPMSTSQGPSSLIPQQDQQLRNTTELQTHSREAPTGILMKVNHTLSTDPQEERHDQLMGGNPELAREMQSQADVVVKESSIGDDAIACQSHETADAEEKAKANVPAGLGFGGLQPLPARTPKRSGPQQQPSQVAGSSEQGVQSSENHHNNRQGGLVPLTGAEYNGQGPPLMADSRNNPSQASQFFPLLNSSSSQRGGGTDLDIGTLMCQFATNASATTTRPIDQSQGLSVAALSNVMGQVMQNPFMRNVVQQMVEQVGDHEDLTGHGESGNPQVGADFSRLLQQMMPVVSQAMNRVGSTSAREGSLARNGGEASARQGFSGFPDMQSNGSNVSNGPNISGILQQLMPVVAQAFGAASTGGLEQFSRMPGDVHLRNADGRESATVQEQRDEAPVLGLRQPEAPPCEEPDSAPVVKRQKIDVQKALEKLEQGSPPTDILRVVTETAIMLLTRDNKQEPNMPPLAHCLCEDDGLANDYMTLLLSDVASCTEGDV